MQAAALQKAHGIADAVRFEDAPGGLVRAVVSTPQAGAVVYLYGAHITEWAPRGGRPVLFTSSRSLFEPGKAIRGGVPIAFPWFGPRTGGQAGPLHGFARIQDWTLEGAELREDGAVELTFALGANDVSRGLGYDAFHLRFRATFGTALSMEFEVRNDSAAPFPFEEALHTYFAVGDIEQVSVSGLEGVAFIDKTDGFQRKRQPADAIRITGETDRVYLNTTATCLITDPAWKRQIVVEKSGSAGTVVWNPWIAKTKTLADMAPEDWRGMICVETVNALDNAVTIPAGGSHTLRTVVRVAGI
jgi:glucose-6-phosphate 1-epimerase